VAGTTTVVTTSGKAGETGRGITVAEEREAGVAKVSTPSIRTVLTRKSPDDNESMCLVIFYILTFSICCFFSIFLISVNFGFISQWILKNKNQ
jgi:hypothetical protein